MSEIGIDSVLQQIRSLSGEIKDGSSQQVEATKQADFSNLLKQSIDQVNELQQQSVSLSEGFEKGDANVSLAQVMISDQKAGLAFQALTQVRNHLLSAYQDVMNMPL
ncbi:MAG: flagellar hook-basal body complex protein FliE [Gammaproteobacteria bacterium]|nr:flagellar hook-basal body complex protein FliE [Gammaproteobacteria bacterium]